MFASSTFWWYVCLVYGTQQVATVLIRQKLFTRIYTRSQGSLCISDAPSVSTNVSSIAECGSRCIGIDNCDDINVLSKGFNSRLECQLFLSSASLHYGTRSDCRGFQVGDFAAGRPYVGPNKRRFGMRRSDRI
jgi:hypothetical protein